MSKLIQLQQAIRAPKGRENKFGGYAYRNCEDILAAAKSVMPDGCYIVLTDEIICVDGRHYVKANAVFYGDKDPVKVCAFAREPLAKKGMDESQITGAASSYARKYALNGLLAIDNTDDADSQDNRNHEPAKPARQTPQAPQEIPGESPIKSYRGIVEECEPRQDKKGKSFWNVTIREENEEWAKILICRDENIGKQLTDAIGLELVLNCEVKGEYTIVREIETPK